MSACQVQMTLPKSLKTIPKPQILRDPSKTSAACRQKFLCIQNQRIFSGPWEDPCVFPPTYSHPNVPRQSRCPQINRASRKVREAFRFQTAHSFILRFFQSFISLYSKHENKNEALPPRPAGPTGPAGPAAAGPAAA